MRLRLAAALAALGLIWAGEAAAAAPAPASRALGQVIEWDAATDGEHATYRAGPVSLDLSSARIGETSDPGAMPVLTAAIPGRTAERVGVTLVGVPGFEHAMATFTVVRLDPATREPSVIMTSYSGGAHCCMDVQIATPARLGWTVSHLGSFDNEPLMNPPRDLDGDGVAELLIHDDRFTYQFGSFAESLQPVRVFGVRGGVAADLSAEPRFRKVLEKDMAEAGTLCRQHVSGACPAYVADAIRLGRFAEAWKVMLAAVTPDFSYPTERRLVDATYQACPAGQTRPIPDYPTALRLRLIATGYLSPRGEAVASPLRRAGSSATNKR